MQELWRNCGGTVEELWRSSGDVAKEVFGGVQELAGYVGAAEAVWRTVRGMCAGRDEEV